jgi:hypothetical protein
MANFDSKTYGETLKKSHSSLAGHISMAEIPSSEPESRLQQVKDVLKNSKTLKEQLKGVC